MDPFSVIDIIKKVIDDRVKNLHPIKTKSNYK